MRFNQYRSLRQAKRGFTIVELMIAITVFSIVATLVMAGVIYVARQYQQVTNRIAIEEASRSFHQQVLQSLQYTSVPIADAVASGGYKGKCIGGQMYVYGEIEDFTGTIAQSQAKYNSQKPGLYVATTPSGGCDVSAVGPIQDLQNLLPKDAKVVGLSIDSVTGVIKTTFVKSGTDLLDFSSLPTLKCKMEVGKEWCAVVSFESMAKRRML